MIYAEGGCLQSDDCHAPLLVACKPYGIMLPETHEGWTDL